MALFLQCNAAIFIPMSGGETDCLDHLPPQVHIDSHSNVNHCPVFYLKAYLRHTESFRTKSGGSCLTSLFLGNNRQHQTVCAKTISSWVRKVLCVAKAHMSPGSCLGVAASAALAVVFPWYPFWRQVTGPEFLHQLGTISPPTLLLQISTRTLYSVLCWAWVNWSSPGKCQTLTYTESCICWAVEP